MDDIFTTMDAVQALLRAKKPVIYGAARHGEIVNIYVRECKISDDPKKIHIHGPACEEYDDAPLMDDEFGWFDQWIPIESFYNMSIHNGKDKFYLY